MDGRNFFDQPVKYNLITYDNIQKVATSQGDDYATGITVLSLFQNYYKMIAIDLSKQQELDDNPKAIQQINFTGNLDQNENTTMFFIIQEPKRNHFRFFTRNSESIVNLFYFNMISV